MNNITITEPDGKEPLAICRGYRKYLVDFYKSIEMLALRFFSDHVSLRDSEKVDENKAVEHLRNCPKCRSWLHSVVPAGVLRRQSRQSQYCCAGMFCAVEEAEQRNEPKFEFTMFRGEDPCWMIDGKNAFARFCPWCGQRLPEKPFIGDE